MRILSFFFVPALALTYFAGTQYPHHWSFVLLGLAGVFLYALIAQFYKLALDAPEGYAGLTDDQLEVKGLFGFLDVQPDCDHADLPIYVATNESGIVPAHDLFTARFAGQTVLIVGSDLTKREGYGETSQRIIKPFRTE